ncbi:NTE family protein [Arcanobacterium wilhelmae]|uniref:NTE family protein n=1 Tax=Arcanobacterium wilhelmae TaxID=1803177 RepID=A0ABT9NC58_9ACTO|nr:patatin-like phospholipase family protein [Arcanobacterium wilhelmae]MDP9801305.1 NTE family protein [Arcanobacterium wilhelmae]WFN90648.1 patatin-like phospholipase family protein [Arcanobacterium wilhelmae]
MKIALVLGSGGARGYAHIGVIEEIKKRGHEIVAIAGCSMGAVVGGVEAAGHLDEFTTWVSGLSKLDVLRLIGFTIREPGIVNPRKVMARIDDMVGGVRIEDLPIPFTAVATNLITGREVWFQQGSLAAAIRASMAVPSIVTPVHLNGQLLADGGLVNPVPMEAVAAVKADATLAVSLAKGRTANVDDPRMFAGGAAGPVSSDDVREESEEHPALPVWETYHNLPKSLRTRDVADLSISAMQAIIERFRWAANPASYVIEIPYTTAGTMDLHRAAEVIEVGRTEAIAALDAYGL